MAVGVDHFFNEKWSPYWGDKTSTLDWCEENYLYSQYFAEFWNSTSNFYFMFIAAKGCYNAYKAKLPIRFVMLYAWIFVVGTGSLLFHATLKWYMQLLDEIPMIFMACQILHCIVYPNRKSELESAPWYIKSSLPLHSIALLVSASYVFIGNPIFHEICFGAILVGCFLYYGKFLRQNISGHKKEKALRSSINRMIVVAIASMLIAFAIWNVDNVACKKLRFFRSQLRGPFVVFTPLLQFHALWHILTVIAADYIAAGIIFTWCQGQGVKIKARMQYKLFGTMPIVRIEQRHLRHRIKDKNKSKSESESKSQ